MGSEVQKVIMIDLVDFGESTKLSENQNGFNVKLADLSEFQSPIFYHSSQMIEMVMSSGQSHHWENDVGLPLKKIKIMNLGDDLRHGCLHLLKEKRRPKEAREMSLEWVDYWAWFAYDEGGGPPKNLSQAPACFTPPILAHTSY